MDSGSSEDVRLCERAHGGKECVYLAIRKMVGAMKDEVARTQAVEHPEQIVVARIYDIVAQLLSEACRRNFKMGRQDCDPSAGFKTELVTLDAFILLNQLKEDGYISEEYKRAVFDSLKSVSPEIKKLVEGDAALGLI